MALTSPNCPCTPYARASPSSCRTPFSSAAPFGEPSSLPGPPAPGRAQLRQIWSTKKRRVGEAKSAQLGTHLPGQAALLGLRHGGLPLVFWRSFTLMPFAFPLDLGRHW